MALKDGHHKTKRPEGTRNCFYCHRDVKEWMQLTWPNIQDLFVHCGMACPAALVCKKCQSEVDSDKLYKTFLTTVMVLECRKYREKKQSIIKDKQVYNLFMKRIEEVKEYLYVNIKDD